MGQAREIFAKSIHVNCLLRFVLSVNKANYFPFSKDWPQLAGNLGLEQSKENSFSTVMIASYSLLSNKYGSAYF